MGDSFRDRGGRGMAGHLGEAGGMSGEGKADMPQLESCPGSSGDISRDLQSVQRLDEGGDRQESSEPGSY